MATFFKSFLNRDAYNTYVANNDLPDTFIAYIADEDDVVYNTTSISTVPFTITAIDEITVHFRDKVYYSTDEGLSWNYNENDWTYVTLYADDTLQLRGNFNEQIQNYWFEIDTYSDPTNHTYKFSGNIMSLYDPDTFYKAEIKDFNFWGAFSDKDGLIDVSGLVFPANAPDGAFREMFTRCYQLENAGFILPAKVVGIQTYLGMFASCTALTSAPQINASVIKHEAMHTMFNTCSSLVTGPHFTATSVQLVGSNQFQQMYANCDVIENVEDFKWTINDANGDGAFNNMFENCYALETAPGFTIHGYSNDNVSNAYAQEMFKNCTSLNDVSNVIITTVGGQYFGYNRLSHMFDGCTALTEINLYGTTTPVNWSNGDHDWLANTTGGTVYIDANADMNDWATALDLPSNWTLAQRAS